MLLTWGPIFADNKEKTGGIAKVRFVMYDENKNIHFILETTTDFISLFDATEKAKDLFGQHFDTMIDTGALSLLETVQCSVDGIQDSNEWKEHLNYLLHWKETQHEIA